MKKTTGSYIFGTLFLGIAVVLSIWGNNTLQNAKASLSWPKVQGKVLESHVDAKNSRPPKDRVKSNKTYFANIVYEYVVESVQYSSSKVSFGAYGSSDRNHASEIVRRYPKGKVVDVYYNADMPDIAVLEPGVTWSSYIWLGFGVFFALMSAVIFINRICRTNRCTTISTRASAI